MAREQPAAGNDKIVTHENDLKKGKPTESPIAGQPGVSKTFNNVPEKPIFGKRQESVF